MDGRERDDRADRARARAPPVRELGGGRAAEPAHVGDDAHRVGARAVAGRGGGDAGGDGRAAPISHAAARPAARREGGRPRRAALAALLPGRGAGGVRRGDRARAAWELRRGARLDRRAAAHLGPPRVLPLARRAAVRLGRVRSDGRGRRPPRRRLAGVGRASLHGARADLRAGRRLGHRLAPDGVVAVRAGETLARDPRAGGRGQRPARRSNAASRVAERTSPPSAGGDLGHRGKRGRRTARRRRRPGAERVV